MTRPLSTAERQRRHRTQDGRRLIHVVLCDPEAVAALEHLARQCGTIREAVETALKVAGQAAGVLGAGGADDDQS